MEEKKKKSIFKRWWFWVIVVVIVIAGVAGGSGSGDDKDKTATSGSDSQTVSTENTADVADDQSGNEQKEEPQSEETKDEEPQLEAYTVDLTAGIYTAGIDFPAGTYNLTATAGTGNVSTSNMYNGGLNEIMSATPDEYSVADFSNAKLEEGITLNVGSTLTLSITSEAADVAGMTARENPNTEEVQLGSGNYVAGTDFPAGTYDVVFVDGSGNVSTSNMYDGGLNEILGDGSDGFSISQFKNAELEEGVTLTISSCTVKLVPSK